MVLIIHFPNEKYDISTTQIEKHLYKYNEIQYSINSLLVVSFEIMFK